MPVQMQRCPALQAPREAAAAGAVLDGGGVTAADAVEATPPTSRATPATTVPTVFVLTNIWCLLL
jgi:hypothetical protein